MILLAIDTAASLCAACVWDAEAGSERGRAVLDIGKGHAEHLVPAVGEALAAAGCGYRDLAAIAVAVGPGSFTGIRVGVAAARGYALALGIPALGVGTLEAIAAEASDAAGKRPVLAVLDAGRGEVHAALYGGSGEVIEAPQALALADAAAVLAAHDGAVLAGTAATAIAEKAGRPQADLVGQAATADIAVFARLAAARPWTGEKPAPLYLRPPDAKPQAGFVLPRRAS